MSVPGVEISRTSHPERPIRFGSRAVRLTCPNCRRTILTIVESIPTIKTHILAVCMCFLFPPLCPLPYFFEELLIHEHYCPFCGLLLGRR